MPATFRLCAFLAFVVVIQHAAEAASPSELIVGKWRDRAAPDDAVIEFSKDGAGNLTETTSENAQRAPISWKVRQSYDNACVIEVTYEQSKEEGAKPLPKEAKPFKWLLVFDGDDSFVFQGRPNEVMVMDRQPVHGKEGKAEDGQ